MVGISQTIDASRVGLVTELDAALRTELFARELYALLAGQVDARDPELARVLDGFQADQATQVDLARAAIADLGGTARPEGFAHRASARVLNVVARVGGFALVLRFCHASEERVARRYGWCAHDLRTNGEAERASRFDRLAQTKLVHAQTLEAWIRR